MKLVSIVMLLMLAGLEGCAANANGGTGKNLEAAPTTDAYANVPTGDIYFEEMLGRYRLDAK